MRRAPKVGQLPLGLAFIIFGGCLLAEANGLKGWLEWGLRLWPLLLVAMGLEVFWHTLGQRGDEPMRMDIGSIFLILVLVATCGMAFVLREAVAAGQIIL